MAQRVLRHHDGSVEKWDDATGNYTLTDSSGAVTTTRALTDIEHGMLDPDYSKLSGQDQTLRQFINDGLDALVIQELTVGMRTRLYRLYWTHQLDDAALVRAVNRGWITDAQRQNIEATPPPPPAG